MKYRNTIIHNCGNIVNTRKMFVAEERCHEE